MIHDKAAELGRLIGQSEEYKALRRADDLVRDQDELKEKMDRLAQLAQAMEQTPLDGEPPAEQIEAYNTLLGEIQGHPKYQGVVTAQSNFDKLMLKVNETILEGMRKGAESPIITLS